ncbi:hypothetical protein L9F63_017926, partial [Diploptera punctata]
MADVKSLEHPTLKVPYELLNKKFRAAQKQLDREVSHVQAAAMELERGLHGESVGAGDISRLLGGMVERLQVLKRKAVESISEELEAAYVCKRRLEHLREHTGSNGGSGNSGTVNLWRRRRLDRMLVEYFLRRGYYGAATRLAHRSDLRDLTNIDVFLVSREVEHSLANRETAKNDQRMDAVRHARKFFSSFEDDQLQDVQHCMALLAFPTIQDRELLDESRWDRLVEQFRQENYRLFQLASQSVFTVALQAGLSALKTPYPFFSCKNSRNPSCPVCQDALNELAQPLPFAHCSQSRLVCTISGLPLNEHNQPMMLPNGYVYGEQ